MLIDPRLPDPRPWFKQEAKRKKEELLERNQGFALTVVAGILGILLFACVLYKLDALKTLQDEYYPDARADLTSLVDAYRKR